MSLFNYEERVFLTGNFNSKHQPINPFHSLHQSTFRWLGLTSPSILSSLSTHQPPSHISRQHLNALPTAPRSTQRLRQVMQVVPPQKKLLKPTKKKLPTFSTSPDSRITETIPTIHQGEQLNFAPTTNLQGLLSRDKSLPELNKPKAFATQQSEEPPHPSSHQIAKTEATEKKSGSQNSIFSLMQSNEFNLWRRTTKKKEIKNSITNPPITIEFKKKKKKKIFSQRSKYLFTSIEQEVHSPIRIFQQHSKAFVHKVAQIFNTKHQSFQRDKQITQPERKPSQEIRDQLTLESSLGEDMDGNLIKWKSQTSSPRLTFHNQLSVITPYQIQPQPQDKKPEQSLNVIIETMDKQNIDESIAVEKKKERIYIQINIRPPSAQSQEIKEKLFVPNHYQQPIEESKEEDFKPHSEGRPKNMLKHAIKSLMNKKKAKQKSHSILKLIHQREDGQSVNGQEDQIMEASKVKRYLKLYLQNRFVKTLEKVEFTSLFILQLINEKKPISMLTEILLQQNYSAQFSAATSRMFTGLSVKEETIRCQRGNEIRRQFEQPEILYKTKRQKSFEIDCMVLDLASWYGDPTSKASNSNKVLYMVHGDDSVISEESHGGGEYSPRHNYWKTVSCADKSKVELTNNPMISSLDDETRNTFLSQGLQSKFDLKKILQPLLEFKEMEDKFKIIGRLHTDGKGSIRRRIQKSIYRNYYDIVMGNYEDTQELSDMNPDHGVISLEITEIERRSPDKIKMGRQTSCQDFSLDRPNRKKNTTIDRKPPISPILENSPKSIGRSFKNYQFVYKSVQKLTPRNKARRQSDLHSQQSLIPITSQNSLTPYMQKQISLDQQSNESFKQRSDEPSNSTDEKSKVQERKPVKTKSTISTKETETRGKSNSKPTIIIEQQSVDIKKVQTTKHISMTKHSLSMRTHIQEAERRKMTDIATQVKRLIQNEKHSELSDLLDQNVNANLEEKLPDGNTYLIAASQAGSTQIVQLLLTRGAKVNTQNEDGDTALHKALAYHNFSVADCLISAGASQSLRNNEGFTPWQLIR